MAVSQLSIFISHSSQDNDFGIQLTQHLRSILNSEALVWYDAEGGLQGGDTWWRTIVRELATRDVFIIIISPDAMQSQWVQRELDIALNENKHIIPILYRPCEIRADLKILQMVSFLPPRDYDVAFNDLLVALSRRGPVETRQPTTSQSPLRSHILPQGQTFVPANRRYDWGEAPDVSAFFGRTKELILLEQWLTLDRCRLVSIVGMKGIGKTKLSIKLGRGGIGKTDLSLKLARSIEEQFDYIVWRRLLNAPKMSEILTDLIEVLSDQQEVSLPDTVNEQISRLLHYLRKSRCLVILDNVEMILQGAKQFSQYSPGYEEYGQLFEQIAEVPHQSCLLLTSREKTPEVAGLESKNGPVRSLELRGLHVADAKKIFAQIGFFSGSKEDWKQLNALYNGNPLALELAARHIKEVFFGRITGFLKEGKPIFADLRGLLNWHFDRLSDFHKELMYWFAINREPKSLSELKEDLSSVLEKEQISSILYSLQGLIPLEKSAYRFTIQPVLIQYMTERFVEQIVKEIRNSEIRLFNTHAVLKTSVPDYIRDIQTRLILKSIIEQLLEIYGNRVNVEKRLREIISLLQERFRLIPGYAGGNVLNLLCYLEVDLKGYNFSSLAVWHAYLRGVSMQETNFAHSDLTRSVFTDIFSSSLSVAFSPKGDLLAAGMPSGELRLWYVDSGTPLLTLTGHANWVRTVTFSPDGHVLASGGDDRIVRLWEISSGQCIKTFSGHTARIWTIAFSPDGNILFSGGEDAIRLWDSRSGQCLKIVMLQDHADRIRTLAFSSDGRIAASGSEDRTIRLWEIDHSRCIKTLSGHTGQVRSVAISPDGQTVASGSKDQTIRLWDVDSGQCLHTLHGHLGRVRSVVFSPDGNTLLSGSEDQTVRVWEVKTGQCIRTFSGHKHWIWAVAISPDGRTAVSGSEDRTVRLWDMMNGLCLRTLHAHTDRVRSVAISPDGRTVVSGSEDQMVRSWNINSEKCLKILSGHTNWIRAIAFCADGQSVVSGSEDQTIRLWDIRNGQCLWTLSGHTGRIWTVACSPDGKIVASGSEDQAVRLWNISNRQCIQTLQGHTDRIRSVAFSPNGNIVLSGAEDQTIRLWDVSSGQCLHTFALQDHTNRLRTLAFSPNGLNAASGAEDQTIRLWDVNSGQCLHTFTLQGHTDHIRALAFSPDGRIVASGGADQTLRLWETTSGQVLQTLSGHTDWVSSIAFSSDGSMVISSSYDGTIKGWSTQTGRCLKTMKSGKPYERMNITGAIGLSVAQKTVIKALGAIEDEQLIST